MSKSLNTAALVISMACALLLVSCAVRHDRTDPKYVTTDGAWWFQRSPTEKGLAVEAAINGYRWGYADAQLIDLLSVMSANDRKAIAAMKTSTPDFNKPIRDYIAAIDDFYKVYPQSRSATIADILGCLYAHPKQSCSALAHSLRSK